ncbi:MAG: hypothetical protein ACQESA_00120 [Patescibacteria group bacterium]
MSDGFYTEIDEAKDVIDSRGKGVKKSVEDWWIDSGVSFPSIFNGVPYAILARNIPTFRYEDAVFVKMAERVGLTPLWMGYSEDFMVSASSDKISLINPVFAMRMGKNGGVVLEKKRIACCEKNEGKKLSEIVCNNGGGSLKEFHRKQLLSFYPEALTWDFSGKAKELGGRAVFYYTHFLSLAISHGVLFEDYHGDGSDWQLNRFTNNVFEPAFKEVKELFGCAPVIVKMSWRKELDYYPSVNFVNYNKKEVPWKEQPFARLEEDL